MNVLVAGGGTGGHLFPGLAVADAFIEADPGTRVAFAGTENGIEARIIPNTPFRLFTLPVMGLVKVGFLRRLLALAILPSSLAAAYRILNEFKPDLVVGVGGYASAPILFAAGFKRIPRVILEQNAIPGVTNRVFGPSVDRVFLSFESAREGFKQSREVPEDHFSCPGNPVRRTLVEAETAPGNGPNLLIFGGSQGAEAINEAVIDALPDLLKACPDLTITHQTGRNDITRVRDAFRGQEERGNISAFIEDMGPAYAAADLVLCRSGATTTAELTALGKPSILVPYPHATHDHQKANARALEEAGAAVMLTQDKLNPESLTETVQSLLENPDRLATMGEAAKQLGRPDAARRIVAECLELLGRKTSDPS